MRRGGAGMILGHYGRWVAARGAARPSAASRATAARRATSSRPRASYGLDAKGFKYERARQALRRCSCPCILFWNFNHFVVLEGFKSGKVYLNDPAQGPREVTLEELDGSYSGVVLTFEPGAEFKKGGQPPTMRAGAAAAAGRLRGARCSSSCSAGCSLVIPGLVIPTFTRIFIDDYLVGGQDWMVRPLLWFMAATVVIQGVLTWLQQYYLLRLETKLALGTSSRFFNHILRLPAAYFGQRFAGEIGSRVAINDQVAKIIVGQLATTAIDMRHDRLLRRR